MFKAQYYLIKSAAAMTEEHVIGADRAKSREEQPSLPLTFPITLSMYMIPTAETLSDRQIR